MRFVVRLLAPLGSSLMLQQFLPTRASHGFLYFRPKEPAAANSSTDTAAEPPQHQVQPQWVDLPLAWDRILPEAEYRLGEPPSCCIVLPAQQRIILCCFAAATLHATCLVFASDVERGTRLHSKQLCARCCIPAPRAGT